METNVLVKCLFYAAYGVALRAYDLCCEQLTDQNEKAPR